MEAYEAALSEMIINDPTLLAILETVETLNVNDAWVCAGVIRNKVWDNLQHKTTPINDIDVIYFDLADISWQKEKQLERQLNELFPNQPWSVKNQARMHLKSGFSPFSSSYDGVAHFPETPTAVAVRLIDSKLEIMAPYGLDDLFEMKVKPTPEYQKNGKYHSIYVKRMNEKKWKNIWKTLSVEL